MSAPILALPQRDGKFENIRLPSGQYNLFARAGRDLPGLDRVVEPPAHFRHQRFELLIDSQTQGKGQSGVGRNPARKESRIVILYLVEKKSRSLCIRTF